MAHASTPVSTALPAVGLFPLDLPADGPSIQILEIDGSNGYLIAYDRQTWAAEQILGYAELRFGAFDLVEAPKAGA